MSKKPVALIILDGFALRDEDKGNAVTHAKNQTSTVSGTSILMLHFRRLEKL